jgi:hypothetical protein
MTYFEGGDLHLVADDVRKALIGAASAVRELPNIQILSRSLPHCQSHRDLGCDLEHLEAQGEEDEGKSNTP